VAGAQDADGSPRHLQLTCQGPAITFTVDGVDVAQATDPSPARGNLALMAGLLEPGKLMVAFDDLRITRP